MLTAEETSGKVLPSLDKTWVKKVANSVITFLLTQPACRFLVQHLLSDLFSGVSGLYLMNQGEQRGQQSGVFQQMDNWG